MTRLLPESWVQWRSVFKVVLKKVFSTFSYLYLWHTMWYHTEKLLKTLKFWKSLNSLCKSGSRPQKSPKKAQKTDHSIAIYSNFLIGMVYFGSHLVNPHVQAAQNMYGKWDLHRSLILKAQKLTRWLGLQHPPKSTYLKSCPLSLVFFIFLGQNWISRPNGQLLHIACHT